MLNNKTKHVVIALAAFASLIASVGVAEARYEGIGSTMISPNLMEAADLVLIRLERPGIDPVQTASLAPALAARLPSSRSTPDYNVFRSVVVPVGKLPAFGQWAKVRPSAGMVDDFCVDQFCANKAGRRLADAATEARGLDPVAALKSINLAVNRAITYRSDRGDTWQTLAQSAARGAGDCEDYAIAKMELLAEIGFAPEQLQFIVLKDTRRQLYHAVLAVHVEGKRYILDNLTNTVASDEIFRTYRPIASFVGDKTFIHGFRDKSTAVASRGGFSAIQLGEGS